MADEPQLDSFLVEIGFQEDQAGQKKVEAAVAQTEAKITAATEAGAAKRVEAEASGADRRAKSIRDFLAKRKADEEKANDERSEAFSKFLTETLGFESKTADKVTAKRADTAAKATASEATHAKKTREIRSGEFKQAEAYMLRFASFSQGLATGLSGFLSAVPFGTFLTGVVRTADGLSHLAVQGARVGSSVAGIQRFEYALQQAGVDKGEADSSLEGFATKMKSNPEGYRQVLERMDVRTRGPDGKVLDNDQLLERLGTHLSAIPYNQAKIQADQLGISGDNALMALRDQPTLNRNLKAYDAKLGAFGLDPDKAAEDARKVAQAYNSLEADLKIINTKIQAQFFVPMMDAFDGIAKKLEANPAAVETFSNGMVAMSVLMTAKVLPVVAELLLKLTGLAPVLGGIGGALRVALNPVVAVGASAESTPSVPVTTDPAERAKKMKDNTLPASEWTKEERDEWNKKQGQGGNFLSNAWNWGKKKLGFGGTEDSGAVPTGAHTPLKDLIAERETGTTGAGGYETAYGHAERGGPLAPPKPLTEMTLAEIQAYQREMKPRAGSLAFPVGRGQWTESTLRGLTKDTDPNTKFTPDLQEKLLDKSIAGRLGQGPAGFRNEWDSFRGLPDAQIQAAIDGHRKAMADAQGGQQQPGGTKGQYPDWMDDRSKRELAGVNAPLARDLLAASEATGQRFKVAQGMRTPEEAAGNALSGRGVRNSQHLYGAAADIHILDANGNVTYDRAAYQKFADAYVAHSRQTGGQSRWLGNAGGRWGQDIVHFDQGLGYGQSRPRDPYGSGGPTKEDVAASRQDVHVSRQNPFMRAVNNLNPVSPAEAKEADPHPASHGRIKALLSWIDKAGKADDASDTPITTVDRRDPRFAPKSAPVPSAAAKKAPKPDAPTSAAVWAEREQSRLGTKNSLAVLARQHLAGPVKVEIIDSSVAKIGGHLKGALDPTHQKLADAMNTDAAKRHALVQHFAELGRHGKLDLAHMMRLRHPLGVAPAMMASVNNSRSHSFERHGDTFHIHGTDAKSGMDQALKVSARREGQDRIRYGQGSQQ